MVLPNTLFAIVLATHTWATPTSSSANEPSFSHLPVGGSAICISGTVDVTASAKNIKLNTAEPANQIALTDFTVETLQTNSTIAAKVIAGENDVSGTYGIYSQLCFPASGKTNATTVQFLTHGVGCDRSYWNIVEGYSYVDYAAEQGYITFFYDRLGSGASDHPDPIQEVQPQLQVVIAHKLTQLLRNGGIAGVFFDHVVGVGHSFGSFISLGITTQYPDDFDAAVLTGFSSSTSGMPIGFSGFDLVIASQNFPERFSNLSNGYLTGSNIIGTQFSFFRSPGFDAALLQIADATKQTISIGEFLLQKTLFSVATNFTGPIDVVSGESDFLNCFGNCTVPYNLVAAVKDQFFPAAKNSSEWYLAEGSGHFLNYHYAATGAYEHIQNFIKKTGF
jgi:pimeloyl-ACP methyl ester carboxylesterase